ncbi:MAG: LysR substrate-binding domain-containing protein [Alphaproteobacteria bacterium]
MDIRQLRAFAAVAEFGSFSRAAVALSLGQPVLSRQIKALEGELGARLLHRNGRGIILTEAGKLLDRYAKGMLETASRATSEIAALQSAPRGTVIVGMPPSVGFVLTVPLVREFRGTYPLIAIRVIEGFSGYLLEWLLTGKIDVAVLYNAPRMPNILSEPLLRDQLFLLGAAEDPSRLPAGPVAARRLTEIPLVLPSRPHGLRLVIDQVLGKAGITLDPELEVDAVPSTQRLVEEGLGYTIHSYSSVHHLVEEGRIRTWPIIEPELSRQLILATSSQRPATAATRALTDMIRRQVKEQVRKGIWHPRRRGRREA